MDKEDPEQLDLDLGDSKNALTGSDSCYYTITLDPSLYNMSTSITSPCTITWSGSSSNCYSTIGTIPNSFGSGTYSINNSYNPASVCITTDGIAMQEGTDIKIGKQSLTEVLAKLEERLDILHHNSELEDKWQELKDLGNRYRELEKDLIEKEKMWKILKDA